MKEHFNIKLKNSEVRIYVHPKFKDEVNKIGNIISETRKAGSKQAIEAFFNRDSCYGFVPDSQKFILLSKNPGSFESVSGYLGISGNVYKLDKKTYKKIIQSNNMEVKLNNCKKIKEVKSNAKKKNPILYEFSTDFNGKRIKVYLTSNNAPKDINKLSSLSFQKEIKTSVWEENFPGNMFVVKRSQVLIISENLEYMKFVNKVVVDSDVYKITKHSNITDFVADFRKKKSQNINYGLELIVDNSKQKPISESENFYIKNLNKLEKSLKEASIYVDGSCKKGCTGSAAAVVVDGEVVSQLTYSSKIQGYSLHAELTACKLAIEFCAMHDIGKVKIYYDCEAIRHYYYNIPKSTVGKNYHSYMKTRMPDLDINFIKVKAHSGNKFNNYVDRLAKELAEKQIVI